MLIDDVDEDVAAVHFELAVDRYVAGGYSPRTQEAARSVLGTPADDAGYAFAFAAKVGGARGELIRAQALRLWEDDQAARDAERAAIEAIDSPVSFYGLLDDHLLLIPDGPAIHAYVDGHDVVSLVDGLATAKGMTPGRLGFDPRREPWRIDLMGRHRLRSLLAGEHMSRLRSLRIRTWGGTARLDPVLSSYSAGDRLSHLCLPSQRDDLAEAPVAGRYPGLRALECPVWQVARLLRDGAHRLHTLVAYGIDERTPSLLDMLAGLSLPALRQPRPVGDRRGSHEPGHLSGRREAGHPRPVEGQRRPPVRLPRTAAAAAGAGASGTDRPPRALRPLRHPQPLRRLATGDLRRP